MYLRRTLLALALVAALAGPARADFLGHVIEARRLFPDVNTTVRGPVTVTVTDPGVEFPNDLIDFNQPAHFDIDLGAATVRMELFRETFLGARVAFLPAPFNGVQFFDVNGTLEPIVGVTINPATNLPGFDASRITFDADNVFVNLQGLGFVDQGPRHDVLLLDVHFDAAAVPEPASLTLAGIGLSVLAGVGLRRTKR